MLAIELTGTPLIELNDVSLQDTETLSLDGETNAPPTNLSVNFGELIGLLGPTSGGKQMVLELLSLRRMSDCGQLFWRGEVISFIDSKKLRSVRMRIGVVMNPVGLISNISVLGNILLPLRYHYQESLSERMPFIESSLRRLGLFKKKDVLPAYLTAGEQRLAGIVRALAVSPLLIVLDEPFADLNPSQRDRLMNYLLEVHEKEPYTLVATSDHLSSLQTVTRRSVSFDYSRIIHDFCSIPTDHSEVEIV